MRPLAAVKQELLVRYLDAWTPAALHHARRVTYVDAYPSRPAVAAATGVFTEFADVLAGHRLTVLLAGAEEPVPDELPEGLEIRVTSDPVADLAAARALATPVFAYLDAGGRAPMAGLLGALGAARAGEALVALHRGADPEDFRRSLLSAGFRLAVVVELVENGWEAKAGGEGNGWEAGGEVISGGVERLFFATSTVRSLERFKDALWAVDEYAGVRYRDPRDGDHPPLDISLEPHVGPLRRALLARLAADGGAGVSVAALREYALSDTLYRPADVNRALQPMLAAGQLTREPARGRLTPQTLIALPTRR